MNNFDTRADGKVMYEKIEPGTYPAVCIGVYGLGFQKTSFQGKEKITPQIRLIWEVEERDSKGRRFIVARTYSKYLTEKANLRKDLVNWRGKEFTKEELDGFDVSAVNGASCMLNIIRDKKDYVKVTGVSQMPKTMPKVVAEQQVPPRMVEKIEEIRRNAVDPNSGVNDEPEYQETSPEDDEIPF